MPRVCVSSRTEVAHLRRRFNYRHIHDVLRPLSWAQPQAHLPAVRRGRPAVRKRRKVKRPSIERRPLLPAAAINEVWSMDFVATARPTAGGSSC